MRSSNLFQFGIISSLLISFQLLFLEEVESLSRVQLFVTPWTVAYKASLSMEFSRQAYWSGLPFPSPGDLPDPGIEPGSPALQADTLPSEPPGKPFSLNNPFFIRFPSISTCLLIIPKPMPLAQSSFSGFSLPYLTIDGIPLPG